jgi:hypothetical protein
MKRAQPRGRPKKVCAPDWDAGKAADPSAPATKPPSGKPKWATKFSDASKWSGEFSTTEEDRLAIPQETIDDLARQGIVVQWFSESVYGQAQEHRMGVARKNGWMEVQSGEIPNISVVAVDGLRLMARPAEIHKHAQSLEKATAQERVSVKEQQLRGGDLGIPGADHPSAVRSNKVNRTLEKIEIPK